MSGRQAATRKLLQEMRQLQKEPIDGAIIDVDEDNIFSWKIALFGPPDTPYAGGYFKARLDFPDTYPFNPPNMRFTSRIWHPNVFPNGNICISILHSPGTDHLSGERPEERWNPTQTVRTILLSVISILNEPNTSSPANVDANVSFLKYKRGESDDYLQRVKHDVQASQRLAKEDGVTIPSSIDDYVIKHKPVEEPVLTADDLMDSDVADSDEDYDYDHDSEGDDEDANDEHMGEGHDVADGCGDGEVDDGGREEPEQEDN
ncbi:ubiquitin-conjugating enzyme [Salpingoeca rosetta]|uniref:Ubiquitin-conjugating enzyme n=1 Tax=Salpingoeca rosetta (strain ATCC 50818 / BSB-021) TaxID=946362 RepID=F2TWM1_SALR5|nr:ubiquitin-conjugating enzyme [Salpingoeca rosetta]EGD72467.1 ubiquitin-conjugating enzyme [Salpingoeca rosetta]|eukprot:XP_004999036.1 ubiquitin-conjugating enzyme [Salpingoeca rosetta]